MSEKYRLGMTDDQRSRHVPGKGLRPGGIGGTTAAHLNLTRSMADVVKFVRTGASKHVWIDRETGREI